MNLKTTLILAVLVVVGGIGWLLVLALQSGGAANETLNVLEHELTPGALTRIDVRRGEHHVTLEKTGGDWSLPGKWPVRQPEVQQLVRTLTGLRSRFVPIALGSPPALGEFGLDGQPLVVTVRAGGKDFKLTLGEKSDKTTRFSSPTYLRLGDQPEVVRLAPGLVGALDRPEDYYMQRRLFPAERVATGDENAEKVEQLAARAIEVKSSAAGYTLSHAKDTWELSAPIRDHVDPEKLKAILVAVPDIWAERFVDRPDMTLDAFGLKDPEQTLRVTRPNGDVVTLLVGKQSDMKIRKVMKPGLPDGSPFPPKPRMEIVHEEYRFAKLRDNDRVFEIKADRLKDLVLAPDALRDAQLARFKPEEVTRVVIEEGGRQLVLAKEKDRWRLEKPTAVAAETPKVTELLDKLSGLQARDKDVIDKGDLKKLGLDKPATVTLTVAAAASAGASSSAEDAKKTSPREITFALGSSTADTNQVYVQVAGWPRVNAVSADLLKLVRQPALAYRSRRVLDFASTDLSRIEVRPSKGEPFTLEQDKGRWRLAVPVAATIESSKAEQLAGDLGRLEVTEFVTVDPKKDDLEKVYGLDKPVLSVKALFTDAKKPQQTLLVGKQRPGKEDYYARLASDPAVFVVSKETHATIDKDSLAYRDLELWQMQPEEVAELRVHKSGPEYRLDRVGEAWKISGPFEAPAAPEQVTPMVKELASLKAERFTAHNARDLGAYGLDKPYLRVTLKAVAKKDAADKADKKDGKEERVLLIGKAAGKEGPGRFARLADGEAIFVVADKFVAAVDRDALDLLEPKLLGLEAASIRRIQTADGNAKFLLTKEDKQWRVTESPAPPFAADNSAVDEALRVWSSLRASKFAAYGDKIDLAKFGLEKPAATVTVTEQLPGEKDKPGKATLHTLFLGKPVEGSKGERYARLDKGLGVAVLPAETVKAVTRTYLDYVNHTVFALDAARITGVLRRGEGRGESETLELARRSDKWQIVKPADLPADGPTVTKLLGELANLRAMRVAAFPAKDLQGMGLDKAAAVTIRLTDDKGKPVEHVLRIGKVADKDTGARYARADSSAVVVVVAGHLAKQLLAGPLQFRDRDLARIAALDKVMVERGSRKATFTLADGTWKMTEPLATEAESADLEAFLAGLRPLRADELVADKPGDVKPYGLDRPLVRWRFLQGGKEVLTLLVGAMSKAKDDKGRAYARLGTGDLIFLLDAPTTARALGEYRSRKVWGMSAPDAAQVEKLQYGYVKSPYIIQKINNEWHVGDKPMAKVNMDAVRDALDSLAGLQAERYVADKGEDLKLYGLAPPALVLQLETPTGKRVLHVGRKEGESERYYALVPGPEGSAVFVLSGTDARRIVRPLEAFLTRGP